MRALQIDLDDVYDRDPKQTERNLDKLIQRVHDIGPNAVFLQAFADPDGNGAANAVYFPNRHLPMRADLFSRVAWQLRTRAHVKIFAWLPVLGWQPPTGEVPDSAKIVSSNPKEVPRLDPRNPAVQRLVEDEYADLASHSQIDGVLFHDDAYLRDDELRDLGQGNPAARTKLLIDFTPPSGRRDATLAAAAADRRAIFSPNRCSIRRARHGLRKACLRLSAHMTTPR